MLSSCHFTSFEKQFRRSTATRVSKRLIIKKIKNEEQKNNNNTNNNKQQQQHGYMPGRRRMIRITENMNIFEMEM